MAVDVTLMNWRLYGRFVLACVSLAAAARAAGAVDYARDVRPILAENCFNCHGQDAGSRKGKLRLDTREGQAKEGVIVAGKPEQSELVARILSPHEDEVMPPPEAKRPLTDAQKAILKQWVQDGAPFAEHWAFTPPVAVSPPGPGSAAAGGGLKRLHPIDAFVRAELARQGLTPAAPADRERLIRRVTLDLTGLPPTLAEIDAFLADTAPDAFERVVDRLLASSRYGERMAADWLDVARYADTHGYQMDRPRAMWPYRDWVIAAFNRNLSYDRFLTEQLAGDLLPNATRDQRLATAFNRLHAQNEEGGIVDEEYRVSYVNDRVTTFGTAVLGLTLDCARCHDHKFDPITQRDFYALSAFFQNIDEAGAISYKGFSDVMPPPVLKLPTVEEEQRLESLRAAIAQHDAAVTTAREEALGEFTAWRERVGKADTPLAADAALTLDFDTAEASGEAKDGVLSGGGKFVESPAITEGRRGGAVLLGGDDGVAIADAPVFSRGDAFSFSLWVRPASTVERAVVFHRSLAYTDAGSRGYELVLEHGRVAFALHRHWPGDSLKVVTLAALPEGRWSHLTLTYDGSSTAAGARVFIDGIAAPVEVVRDKLKGDITYDREKQPPLLIGHRFRDNGFKGGRVDEFRIFAREVSPLEAAHLADANATDNQAAWKQHYLLTVAPAVRAATAKRAELRRAFAKAYDAVQDVMVMDELPQPKRAYVLDRGDYASRGAEVTATTPAVLPPMRADQPPNRLGLARWATDPGNPLTARVAVNRFWQMLFDRGLVESTDNFGVAGSMPTHPQLLDWLAVEFMRSGWDMKALLRTMVLSETYRQATRADAESRGRDPQNLWLARAPARRLTAEMLRDQALAASGLLAEKIGGPAVKPYQPPGLWEEIAMGKPKYEQSTGDGLYRRSLYTFWKRTVPHPAMVTFDATERAVCVVKRQSTSTPTQALALLNDTQLIEAARFVATRMLRDGGATTEQRMRTGFRLLTSRLPTNAETAVLVRAFEEQRAIFAADAEAAAKLLRVGEKPADADLPPAELAAATMVASLVLNHDEAVMRR
jgi:mono/diheme cytochrome c family protein